MSAKKKKLKRRRVAQYDGEKRVVYEQPTEKGFDVEMVRDFLDYLLLEVRTQQFENVMALRKLKEIDSPDGAFEPTISESLVEQHKQYLVKYQTALVPALAIDGEGASQRERLLVTAAALQAQVDKRDEQIGHLENLRELFDEALQCAKVPFGAGKDGMPIQPARCLKVRDWIDRYNENNDGLPSYESLAAIYPDHYLASLEGVEALKAATVVVFQKEDSDRQFVVYGVAEVERLADVGKESVTATVVQCGSPEELQLLLAALRKFKGRYEFDGDPAKEFWGNPDEP